MCGIGGIWRWYPAGATEVAGLHDAAHECVQQRSDGEPSELGARAYGTGAGWTIDEAWLDTIDHSISQRGPDGCGRFRDAKVLDDGRAIEVAFVHRRLSIIDHDGGGQPMLSEHGRDEHEGLVAVVFNGCIYNHAELRKELEQAGRRFATDHSDTEVLIHGWREWGHDLPLRLDGMFAFAVWDRERAEVFSARDLAGEKPLFQISGLDQDTRGGTFGFSSSAVGVEKLGAVVCGNSWRADEAFRRTARRERIGQWVRDGAALRFWSADPIWEGFWSTSGPACQAQHTEYRCFEDHVGPLTERDIVPLLRTSVSRRLVADVDIGCFLSGGIDSGLLSALANEELRRNGSTLNTFTMRMPDSRYDESDAAARVAKHLGTKHTTFDCDPQPAETVVELIEQLGLPLGDSSLLPAAWLCRLVRANVKVALSGDGGDELFGGYERHAAYPKIRKWRRLLALIPASLFPRRDPKSLWTKVARAIDAVERPKCIYAELCAIFPRPDMRHLIEEPPETVDRLEIKVDESTYWPMTPRFDDLVEYLPWDLLRKTDTASMAVALEVRCPFLDWTLVQRSMATPDSVIMPNGQRKGLLKRVARQYLPDDIVDRPKMGFAIPIGEWFRTDYGGMRQLLHDHLESSEPWGPDNVGISEFINMDYVRQMLREHDAAGTASLWPWKGRDHSQRLYMLLVLSIWAKWMGRITT